MKNRFFFFLLTVLVALSVLPRFVDAGSGTFSLKWYLQRARADMFIKSYRAAIESYEKALQIDPHNKEAMRNLGMAYEFQGLLDKAVATYDLYLARYTDDDEIAFRQAEILSWSRYSYRRADALRYYDIAAKLRGEAGVEAGEEKRLDIRQETNAELIATYEKALAADPHNRELMRILGKAYETQGLFDQAIDLYARYLKKYPNDSEVAFRQAEILSWARYADRRSEAFKYYRMGLRRKSDPRVRLNYARLLAANKETTALAIREYQEVLKKDPKNKGAHDGLATAYAWQGDSDRALYHSQMALVLEPKNARMLELQKELSEGREPTIDATLGFMSRRGKTYGLRGFGASFSGRVEPNAFTTAIVRAGHGDYWHAGERADDGTLSAALEVRVRTIHRFNLELGHHTIGPDGRGWILSGRYGRGTDKHSWGAGFKRELKYDSLLALEGKQIAGRSFGAARSNMVYAEAFLPVDEWKLWVMPYVGNVTAQGVSTNGQFGTDLTFSSPVLWNGRNAALSGAYKVEVAHFEEDQSGTGVRTSEPFPGGYFSPQLFVNQTPEAIVHLKLRAPHDLTLRGGPSLQYVRDAGVSGKFRLGGEAALAYHCQLKDNVTAGCESTLLRVSSLYTQYFLTATIATHF